jgi:hypothetical protein
MSLEFPTGARVNVGSASSLDDLFAAGATLVAWVNPVTAGGNSTGRIFDKVTFIFFGNNSTATDTFTFEHARAGTIGRWRMPSSQMSFSVWQHVAVTYDGSSTTNDPIFYHDGVSVTVTEMSTPTSTIASDAANSLQIANVVANNRTFDGRIEDARVYNRILSAQEIATIYACRGHDGIASGLRGRWLLSGEGADGTAVLAAPPDYSGNDNTGSIAGSPVYRDSILSQRCGA